ncbi:MAG: HAD-IA family hydrolase [Acinetobacter sp.]
MTECCLIFDLDGTLVDSELINAQVLKSLFNDLSYEPYELALTYRGWKLDKILADIYKRDKLIANEESVANYHSLVEQAFTANLKAFEGVAQTLEKLSQRKCVASSAPLTKIKAALDVTGLSSFFGEHLFSSYIVGHWKPDPKLFLFAAQAMGVPAQKCIVIEDSQVGITAAKLAGMIPIQFGSQIAYDTDTYYFSDYKDLPALIEGIVSNMH